MIVSCTPTKSQVKRSKIDSATASGTALRFPRVSLIPATSGLIVQRTFWHACTAPWSYCPRVILFYSLDFSFLQTCLWASDVDGRGVDFRDGAATRGEEEVLCLSAAHKECSNSVTDSSEKLHLSALSWLQLCPR